MAVVPTIIWQFDLNLPMAVVPTIIWQFDLNLPMAIVPTIIFLSCQFPSLITVKRKLVGILMQKLNTVVIKKYNKNLINWLNMLIQYDGGYNGHR
jgi:hypothetical protein